MADGESITSKVLLPGVSKFRRSFFYPSLENSIGRMPHVALEPANDDISHLVEPGEEFNLQLISYKIYATPHLWWVLAINNDITNPLIAPKVGALLRAPSRAKIRANYL